ncbi:hypothetical protein LCGC14_2429200 [marine sediment metagenome]|uniref:Uncharacterized protein n=1 Tax=marine sediment metagenome TaxID=412755 RepID=A0A0F9EGE8_9ZZZZ
MECNRTSTGGNRIVEERSTMRFQERQRLRAADRIRRKPPSVRTMERWMSDGIAKATDGCSVEPDGQCPHGKDSWLLELGYI